MTQAAIDRRAASKELVVPAYGDGCITELPAIAASILTDSSTQELPAAIEKQDTTGVDCVVVLVVDGFGRDCWQRDHQNHDALARLRTAGGMSSLTSTFPATTAAAMTSIHTGVAPGRHGIVGWSQYQPAVDRVIEPLPYQVRGGEPGGATTVLPPSAVLAAEPVYQSLAARGIATHVLQQRVTLDSPYAKHLVSGATAHPFVDTDDMTRRLRAVIQQTDRPAYICVHLLELDTVAHAHGTASVQYQSALETLSAALERELLGTDGLERTLLLLTADHGHVDTAPEETISLLEDPVVADNLATFADGSPIRPTGGPRNAHLHLQPGTVSTVDEHLQTTYGVETIRKDDQSGTALLGPSTTAIARRRCGDLVVGHPDRAVWYGDGKPVDRIGQHGWLTGRELLVPLVAAQLAQA